MEKINQHEKTPTTRRVGGWEVRQWRMATGKVSNLMGHVTYTPHTLAPRLPDVIPANSHALGVSLTPTG